MLLDDGELQWLRQFEGAAYALENSGRYADTLAVLARHVGAKTSIVDLGAYPGHLALLLARRHRAQVTGLSWAHPASFAVRMREEGIAVHECDITREAPPLPEGAFDLALCTEIIEHLDRPLPLLVRANRLLRPGGLLVLSTPNHARLACRFALLLGRPTNAHLFGTEHVYEMSEWVHRREYTASELRRLLEPAGFRVEETHFSALDRPPLDGRARLRSALKRLLYLRPALRGGIILVARKTGEAVYTSRVPDVLCATVRAEQGRVSVRAGETVLLPLPIENTGTSTWLTDEAPGYGFVKLGFHLRDREDRLLDFDYFRWPLPHDLPPGHGARLEVRLPAPAAPGEYRLEADLVNEGVSWFHNYGSSSALIELRVS